MIERSALFDEPTQPLARSWREAFARLRSTSPPGPGFANLSWAKVHNVCQRFLSEQAEGAAAMGWSTEDLFGVHPSMGAVRVNACGALMVSGGTPVHEVHPDRISFGAGAYRRKVGALPSVFVWMYRGSR